MSLKRRDFCIQVEDHAHARTVRASREPHMSGSMLGRLVSKLGAISPIDRSAKADLLSYTRHEAASAVDAANRPR